MSVFLNKKSAVWLSAYVGDVKKKGTLISVYDKPVKVRWLVNSLSGSYDVAVFGDKSKNMCRAMLDYMQWIGKIKEKDLVYLYGASPEGEKVNGDNANYRVIAMRPQNLKIAVYFERIVGR